MIILIMLAFLGGIVTILSPCILPILPIVLSGSVTGGKKRPLGVVAGFIVSFTFFTLFLSAIVKATGLSADALRIISVLIIAFFGLSLIMPNLQRFVEKRFIFNARAFQIKQGPSDGVWAGVLIGASLGLVWTPCVGPILASIITLAATSNVGADAVMVTLAYATGTSIPLLAITYGGRTLLTDHPWLLANTARIQKGFGVLMLLAALALFFSWDRAFQTYILETFPNYGTGLTKLEDNALVKQQLEAIKTNPKGERMIQAPEFILGGQWVNSNPLTMQALRGKVVLVDFWTYTCINCIRTLPYLKSWHEKYKDKGLVIVGVHTPEFAFEKDIGNVKKAVSDFGITYAVMQDNDYATWQAYANRYWPAKYLIDATGTIRYTHFGEGEYDQTERMIQKLLSEAGNAVEETVSNPTYRVQTRTPETYLGYRRIAGLASPEQIVPDKPVVFTAPVELRKNTFALSGVWTISGERARPQKDAALTFHFDAAEVFLVMRPMKLGATGAIRVYLDGKPVAAELSGEDVSQAIVKITGDRLYKLIKLPSPGPHILKLEVLHNDIELYAFTFG